MAFPAFWHIIIFVVFYKVFIIFIDIFGLFFAVANPSFQNQTGRFLLVLLHHGHFEKSWIINCKLILMSTRYKCMVIMGLTGLRDSHVHVLALKVLPSRVYLLENTLLSMKWVVPLVKCSFSAGFCHLWFGGFAWLSLNKAMCSVAGGVFWSQRSFMGYAFSILDLLLFLFSDCRSYAVSGI